MEDDRNAPDEPAPEAEVADAAAAVIIAPPEPSASPRRRPIMVVGVVVALVVLVGAGIWYQSSRAGTDDATASAGPGDLAAEPIDVGMDFGTTGGPIVDIYVDYQCIHCADLDKVIGPELARLAASGDAELVIRPVRFLSRASARAAAALYCAAEGGEAFAMHQQLLSDISADFSPDGLTATAGTLGLDEAAFSTCLTADVTTTWVTGVTAAAHSDGITGIPAVFVDGTRLSDAQLASATAFRTAVLDDGA